MQINNINNAQPTFGMAYKISKSAANMLQAPLKKSSKKMANMLALQNAFQNSPDLLEIKRASEGIKGLKKLFLSRFLRVSYGREDIGRGSCILASKQGFTKHPNLYLQQLAANVTDGIYKDARKEIAKSLADAALNSK